jgi:hypothetical protein
MGPMPILIAIAALALPPPLPPASDFVRTIDNPWFPLRPGTVLTSKGEDEGSPATDVFRVTLRIKRILGIRARVIDDRVYKRGRLAERTHDYYHVGRHGWVHYYGEGTAELDRHGHVTSTEGTWRAGRDGAKAGVFMPRHPRHHVGEAFRQEFLAGVADDHFRVLRRHATISTPYRNFRRSAVKTGEWTPLEPGVKDRKWYVKGIGQVAEATIKGGSEDLRLVRFHRG